MSRLVRIPEIEEILRVAGEYNTWPGEESNAKMLQALEEGRQWMAELGIEETGDYSSTYYWAWYWRLHGAWLFNKAEYAAALQDFEHALALSESIERERATSIALLGMGNCLHNLNRFKESVAVLERALQLCNTLGDPQDEVGVRNSLGMALTSMGDYEKAIQVLEQGMAASKQLPHPFGTYRLTLSKGVVHVHVGEHKEAYSQFLKAWAILRDHDAEPDPRIFQNLATTCMYMHDLDRATMWLEMLENNADRALTQDPGMRLAKAELQLAREPTLQHALALLEQVANSRHEKSLDVLDYSITAALHVLIEYHEFEKAASVIEQWHPEFLDAGLYQGDFNMRVAAAMMEVATTPSIKAMESLNELIEEASRSQHHIEHERLLHAQTDLLLALGEHEKAVHSMKEAMDVRDQNQRRTSADLAALALIEHEQEQLNAVTDKQKVLLESFMPKAIVKRLM